jgi:two-component system cell cycle sensor histidine kinase/response regulator CckA
MRVLVVEDEPAVRHVIDRVLTQQGHRVLTAPSAFEAMALLLDFPDPPDLAVLDLIMPGMGGLAYADWLQHAFPTIRLMFITGWLDRPEAAQAQKRGTLLAKPFSPQKLLDTIGEKA